MSEIIKLPFTILFGAIRAFSAAGTALLNGYSDDGTSKLEAQKITEFTGKFDEWGRWKTRMACAFEAAGYGRILTDPLSATHNSRRNAMIYAQLAVATSEGTAHHLVNQFEGSKDGHRAWQAWCAGAYLRFRP